MSRPAIPEETKRKVRQRCFFGCVVCGMPLFDYDHLEGWADVQEHAADNLILLCPEHHALKTRGVLSKRRLQAHAETPFNSTRKMTTDRTVGEAEQIRVDLGSNEIMKPFFGANGQFPAVVVNRLAVVILHHEDGWITLSCALTDAKGELSLWVDRGELKAATGLWDFRYEGTRVRGWHNKGDIAFDATLSAEEFILQRGAFYDAQDRTGYEVKDNELVSMIRGEPYGRFTRCGAVAAGGGFLIANEHIVPLTGPVSGFAFRITD